MKQTTKIWAVATSGVALLGGCSNGDDATGSDGGSDASSTSSGGAGEGASETASAEDTAASADVTGAGESTGAGPEGSESTTSATGSTGGSSSDGFEIGFDVIEITPSQAQLDSGLFMGSYGEPYTRGAAQGVHDPIYIRSMAISLGDDGLVLGIADLPGMGNRFTRNIRSRVAAQTGLGSSRVLIGTTHSHSAPDFQGLWGGVAAGYEGWTVDTIVDSLARAWEGRVPAELRVGTTTAPNENRRDWEFTDDSLTFLDATSTEGERLGVIAVFAAHPTVLGPDNKDISRDWPGYAVDAMQEAVGAPVLLFNGILGDAQPLIPEPDPMGPPPDAFEVARGYGEEVAAAALEAIENTEVVEPELYIDEREWVLNLENGLFNLAAWAGLLRYDFVEVDGQRYVSTQSTYARLGSQLQLVSFPGESVTRNGLAILEAMTTPHTMVLGQTGDSLGYFIPADEWNTGRNSDYEEGVSLGQAAGDTTRDVIVSMIEADAGAPAPR